MHGKPLKDAEEAIAELGGVRNMAVPVLGPPAEQPTRPTSEGPLSPPRFNTGDTVPTRDAFGEALAAVGTARGDVVALDGEGGDSTPVAHVHQEPPPPS